MTYLIKNGRVIDPVNKVDGIFDILVSGGKIEKIEKGINVKADEMINAEGKIIAPGLIDMHTHLREPGREDKETVYTGTRAAVKGGFTTILCMPNTEPPIDSPHTARALAEIIKKDALCNVLIAASITEDRAGNKLTEFEALKKEGVRAVTDDGSSVQEDVLMLDAIKRADACGIILIDHCEDTRLSGGGVVNKGYVSTKLGLRGISNESEYKIVQRDINLAKDAVSGIHIAHISCRESVEFIRKAKKSGIKVTAETAPHYFSLNDECASTYDTNIKMNPPLRAKEDVEAVKQGLADGTIDAIATDHAPHTDAEKDVEFDAAPFGIIGLETALSLAVMELVDTKILSWTEVIMKMSVNPARILGIDKAGLKAGQDADIVIIDPKKEYIYNKESIESKSKNSPFIDWKLKAKATHVFVGGKLVVKDEMIL